MIKQETLAFFNDLAENNSKAWFDANRDRYEAAKANYVDVNQQIIDWLGAIDPGIHQAELEAKKTMMRINRDVRFSNDKSPYNTHFFSYMSQGGRKGPQAGYYLCIAHEGSFIGGGLYKPEKAILDQVRMEIDYNFSEWSTLVEDADLVTTFGEIKTNGRLSRPPKGFDKDNPALEWLKMKDYFLQKKLSNQEVMRDDFVPRTVRALSNAKKLNDFVNRVVNSE